MAKFYSAECGVCEWGPNRYWDKETCRSEAEDHADGCGGKDNMTLRAWG